MKLDLATTSTCTPEFPLCPIKTMGQYLYRLHHRNIIVRRIYRYLSYGRPTHENTTFCPLSDNHICLWSSRHVPATYLAAPQASWHHYHELWNTICKHLLVTALYLIRNPVMSFHHIPPGNRRQNRTCQCRFGIISLIQYVPPTGWFIFLASFGWVRHQ
jgi:hypothetical protein